MKDKNEIDIKSLTEEENEYVLNRIKDEIKKRQLLWCCDTEQFINGLLLGLEIGIVDINKYTMNTNESEEEE